MCIYKLNNLPQEKDDAMKNRREFLKGSLIVAGAAVISKTSLTEAASMFPSGLIYTKENPGRWAGKEGAHVPRATVEGRSVKVVNPHPMTKEHYIVKHTLLTPEGRVLGEKTFFYTDPAAESSFIIPEGVSGVLWVTSFCNLHDLWWAELKI
jgi:superoxide reductase